MRSCAELQANAWIEDLDTPALKDGADGKNVGIAWLPQNSGGKEAVRSSAETAYYQPASNRSNLHLLVRHYGGTVGFDDKITTGLNVFSRDSKASKFVSTENVILAAGTTNTPRILQLSGIGPTKLLESLDVPVVVDSPGVGANFQDHPSFFMIYQCECDSSFVQLSRDINVLTYRDAVDNKTDPNPDSMQDPDFREEAWDEYIQNRTGPFSHAWGNRIVFSALQDLTEKFEAIAEALSDQEPLSHLPRVYAENPTLTEGFLHQRKILESQFKDANAGIVEFTFGGATSVPVALQKPLSRGTIYINDTNPDPSIPPLIDFNAASNPIDMIVIVNALQKAREFMSSDSVSSLQPVELSPGPTIDSDPEIEQIMRESLLSPSFDHPVGTAAMMPRELGGVVDTGLRVYGVEGLWVVDASVMPMLPAAHTQATVYAVAELAAELIQGHKA